MWPSQKSWTLKKGKVPFLFKNLFLDARVEILKKIIDILVETMKPKGQFEINWPLKIQSPRKNEIPILSKKKPILFWGSNKHKLKMKTSRWVFLLNFKQASQSPCCVIGSREKTKFSNWLMKDVIWKKECPKCDFKTSQKNYLFRHIQFHNGTLW